MNKHKQLFREYFIRRIKAIGRKLSDDELEDLTAECSESWENEPCEGYGGKTPREYFAEIKDARRLAEIFAEDAAEGEPLAVIADALSALPGASAALCALLEDENANVRARAEAADLLLRMDAAPVESLTELALAGDTPEELRERAIEALACSDGETVYEAAAQRAADAEGMSALIAGELLVGSGVRSDRVTELLLRLTEDRETLPRALQLIAAYGDESVLPRLKKLAESCDYATYTDIRSAVESLGGELDEKRDWTGDATYDAIMSDGRRRREGK